MLNIDKKEILVSTAKSLFSIVPFAGTALTELVFDYSGRIKQNRLNRFIEILAESITQESDINIDNIKTEDFSDLFEAILKRVVLTKSETKLLRFKGILINELNNPTNEAELIDLYLDLITTLSEDELKVLYGHRYYKSDFYSDFDRRNELKEKLLQIQQDKEIQPTAINNSKYDSIENDLRFQLDQLEKKLQQFNLGRNASHYGITNDKFLFYKQRLFSKGLLIDHGVGSIGHQPFRLMSITEFGSEFINFVLAAEAITL